MSLEEMAPPVEGRVAAIGEPRGHSAQSLTRGRQIYLTSCAKCHGVEPIGRYTLVEWEKTLPEMADESKLDAAERQDLRAYVLTALESIAGAP